MNAPGAIPEIRSAAAAERSLVASAVMVPAVIDEVASIVGKEDFGDGVMAHIWGIVAGIVSEGKYPDATLISAKLTNLSKDEKQAYQATIAELVCEGGYIAHNAKYYAKQVRDASARRKLANAGRLIIKAAAESDTAEDAMGFAENSVLAVRDGEQKSDVVDASGLMTSVLKVIDGRKNGELPGFSFGLPAIDVHATLRPSHLWILAARPGMGKTALALNIVSHIAQDSPVLFASLEMSKDELSERLLADAAGVPHSAITHSRFVDEQWDRVREASRNITNWKLEVADKPSQTASEIASKARRLKRRHSGACGLVVVDYLQLMRPETSKGTQREEQVASMSRALKCMAKELNWPVLCLCQMNRDIEKQGAGSKPMLHHLRESGGIEQDADGVAFLWSDDYHKSVNQRSGKCEFIIRKQRNGPPNETAVLKWNPAFMRFTGELQEDVTEQFASGGYDGGSVPYDDWNNR